MAEISHSASGPLLPLLPGGFEMDQDSSSKLMASSYMDYLKRKLGEWYRKAPQPARKEPVAHDEEEPGARTAATGEDEDEKEEGGSDGGGFLLD